MMRNSLFICLFFAITAPCCSDDARSDSDGGTDGGTDTDADTDADTDYLGSVGDAVYLGPWGGALTRVVEDPTMPGRLAAIVGAGYSTGMYASEDDGVTWTEVAVPTDLGVTSLLFLETGRLIVGTDFEILVTDDFGGTWDDIRNNIEEGSMYGITVRGLAYEPGAPGRLWAALGGMYATAPIWVLPDGETTWTPWNAPTGWGADPLNGAAYFTSIATIFDAVASETLIFATYEESLSAGGGVFCSTDSGATFANCSSDLPNVPFYRALLSDGVVAVAGGHIFGSAYAGVWYSGDSGASWFDSTAAIADAIANDVTRLADGSYLASTYGAGLWRTASLDSAWAQVPGFDGMTINTAAELASGDLLAGPEQLGAYRSADDGATWQVSATGLDRLVAVFAAVDPADPESALVAVNSENTGLGLHTANGVDGWAPIPGLPLPRYTFVDIAPSGRWYAVSDGPTTVANDGIYVSDDGGETFDFIGPLTAANMDHVGIRVVEAGGPDHLVAAGNYFTVDDPSDPEALWVFAMESTDGGASWDRIWEGPGTNGSYSMSDFVALADGDYLLAVAGAPIVRLAADGNSAVAVGIPDAPGFTVTDLAACSADPEVWYVRGYDTASATFVFTTEDGGATWTDVTPTGADEMTVTAVDVHPYDCDLAFAATSTGFFTTSDGGTSWVAHDIGPEVTANAMRVVPLTDDLAAALLVYGRGGVTRVSLATQTE
jgi:photosystem II stability/assembly factor-like uncharacterized protein